MSARDPGRELGVGLTYAAGILPILERAPHLVDVLEVEPQTIWYESTRRAGGYRVDDTVLAQLASFGCAKIVHGVGFPVGGTRPPDLDQFPPMLDVVTALDAVWASEHLSFNKVGGRRGEYRTGFLLPPRQTQAGVRAAVQSVRFMAERLPVPFAVETGVNYLRPRPDEMADGAFVRAVVEGADCGILLDLHNIWTNEVNGRQAADAFLADIPLERVWEVHLAGGMEYGHYWLDAHCDAIPEPVLALARRIVPRLPNLKALIFELYPAFLPEVGLDLVRAQLETLHGLWQLRDGGAARSGARPDPVRRPACGEPDRQEPDPGEWERTLAALVTGQAAEGSFAEDLQADPALDIYRDLLGEFRASMVVSALKLTSRLLLLTLGRDGFKGLLEEYWNRRPPELFASTEAAHFAGYLATLDLDVPHLDDVLAFERAVLAALVDGENQVVPFGHDPLMVLNALARQELPAAANPGDFEVEVTPDIAAPFGDAGLGNAHGAPRRVQT